jgi:tRNA-2-methylthio-N6-dimethylallyladenosine synthase
MGHSLLRNEEKIGGTYEVLVEGVSKKSEEKLFGRTTYNSVVVFPKENYKKGDFVMVKIEDCTAATLIGKTI